MFSSSWQPAEAIDEIPCCRVEISDIAEVPAQRTLWHSDLHCTLCCSKLLPISGLRKSQAEGRFQHERPGPAQQPEPVHPGRRLLNGLPGHNNESERILPLKPGFILATDLDGTLLGGTEQDRAALFRLLEGRADDWVVIFVTGRGFDSVRPLLTDPTVPTPDFVIADVGATVIDVGSERPVQPLQVQIEANWPGVHQVLEALEPFEQLVRQEVPQERRCSFLAEQEQLCPELEDKVHEIGCELLYSADRYLDVLPRGVSKGSTLLALLDALQYPRDSVLVAGDTLNDRSLFEVGLKGVVVGEAEPALVEAVSARPLTHIASSPGAGGILEAMEHHGFTTRDEIELALQAHSPNAREGRSQLLMVYHRLPFEEHLRAGKTHRRRAKSPNGIIPSLLGFFAEGRTGSWIAWSQQATRNPERFEAHVAVDEEKFENLWASRIPLTKKDVDLFYKRFSKEAFWPVIFSFPSKAVFDHEHWKHYVEINRLFAERTARDAKPGATAWIHDYNLWMVPAFLRQLRPDLRIGFFHHTAFPPSDVFNIIPWRDEIVGSLVQCDYVGFHIPRYVENFVDVVRSNMPAEILSQVSCAPRYATFGCALGVEQMTTAMTVGERTIRMGAHPVGIDVDRIREIVANEATQERIRSIRDEMSGRQCIISVERLDYVKGPLEKIHAFEHLLEQHPELHGKVVMVNILTPPAAGMEVYRNVGEKVNQAIGRVNGRFGTIDWTPVRYLLRSIPFEELVAYYAAADLAWISPLRDGLNLVAKEYVAAKDADGTSGVLLLSEFAGAAVELMGAVLVNPFDHVQMAERLYHALTMGELERSQRMRRLAAIVRNHDVHSWGSGFLEAVES